MDNNPPSYSPAPGPESGQPAGTKSPEAPQQIGWAAKLLLAAAVLQFAATIFSVLNIASAGYLAQVRAEIATLGLGGDIESLIDGSIVFATITAIALGIISILLYILIARYITLGATWARLVAGILAIMSLYQLTVLVMPGGIATVLQVLLGIAAVVLCYIKPGSTYFREMQIHKLRLKGKTN